MFHTLPTLTTKRFLPLAAVMLVFAGCNTDPVFVDRQKPEGPTTRMERPEGVELPDLQIVDAQEVDLVEGVLTHRARYRKLLVLLRDYYQAHGYNTKLNWAEAELADLKRVTPYKYILSAEIPVTKLRPRYSIAEADALYEKGLDQMKKGGHGVPALYSQKYMQDALNTFNELIRKYPESDKIDDAAFCCGEILKEYFKDCELIAVKWYERAKEWDPQTPHPALFQAAVVYDYRLKDHARALELYHRVLEEERENRSNATFATRRIFELTDGAQMLEPPRRPEADRTFTAPQALTGATEDDVDAADGEPEASPARHDAEEMVPVIDLGPDNGE